MRNDENQLTQRSGVYWGSKCDFTRPAKHDRFHPGGESQKGNDVTDRITEGMEGREGEGPAAIRDFSEAESLRSSYRNVALFFRGVLNKGCVRGH